MRKWYARDDVMVLAWSEILAGTMGLVLVGMFLTPDRGLLSPHFPLANNVAYRFCLSWTVLSSAFVTSGIGLLFLKPWARLCNLTVIPPLGLLSINFFLTLYLVRGSSAVMKGGMANTHQLEAFVQILLEWLVGSPRDFFPALIVSVPLTLLCCAPVFLCLTRREVKEVFTLSSAHKRRVD